MRFCGGNIHGPVVTKLDSEAKRHLRAVGIVSKTPVITTNSHTRPVVVITTNSHTRPVVVTMANKLPGKTSNPLEANWVRKNTNKLSDVILEGSSREAEITAQGIGRCRGDGGRNTAGTGPPKQFIGRSRDKSLCSCTVDYTQLPTQFIYKHKEGGIWTGIY